MKIGLVLENFDPTRGGLENWTWQFARRLLSLGHEAHIVAFDAYDGAEKEGAVLHLLEKRKSRLERASALAAKLPAMGFDVVHDMGIGWAADIIQPHAGSTIALWEQNLLRIPKWRQIRFWREKRYREQEEIERRQHANERALIVTVSEMLAREFQSLHHLAPSRIRVIANGVYPQKFTPLDREKYRAETRRHLGVGDEVLFLGLAHNLLQKNAEATIRAAAKLAASGVALRVVIGGGKRPQRFLKLAKKLGISHLVTFLGVIDPIPCYAAADVFVHPTWYDPCSLVTLEASSCGLPVITSRCNGAAEFMTDGVEGFVLDDPADVAALAARMKRLLEPAEREKMGAAGRALALRHTFDQQTARFVDLYEEIVSRR
ncbi:MAG TPA: glycosyltransferase family 4 protein [Chthoniobacterales bacterium]